MQKIKRKRKKIKNSQVIRTKTTTNFYFSFIQNLTNKGADATNV